MQKRELQNADSCPTSHKQTCHFIHLEVHMKQMVYNIYILF